MALTVVSSLRPPGIPRDFGEEAWPWLLTRGRGSPKLAITPNRTCMFCFWSMEHCPDPKQPLKLL